MCRRSSTRIRQGLASSRPPTTRRLERLAAPPCVPPTRLEGLGYGVAGATPLLGDNKAVRDIIVKNGASAKTRHFERVAMTVKRFYQQLVVVPYLVGTKHMAADIYTKALDQQTFFSLRDYTLNLDGGPGSRVVLTGQTARLWKKITSK